MRLAKCVRACVTTLLVGALALVSITSVCASTRLEAEAQYLKGENYETLGRYSEAIIEWGKCLTYFSDQEKYAADAQLGIGRAYSAMGDSNNALVELRKVETAYPSRRFQSSRSRLLQAAIYQGNGDYAQAISHYEAVISTYPDAKLECAKAKLGIATCRIAIGQVDEALTVLDKLSWDHPDAYTERATALLRSGKILYDREQYQQAIEKFVQAGSVSGMAYMGEWEAEAAFWLGAAEAKNGQLDEALGVLGTILAEHHRCYPQAAKALFLRGRIYEQKDRIADAVKEYRSVLKFYPKMTVQAADAKARIGVLRGDAGLSADEDANLQRTLDRYQTILTAGGGYQEGTWSEADPVARKTAAKTLIKKARAAMSLNLFDQSAAMSKKVVDDYDELDALNAEALTVLGDAQRQAGKLDEALQTLAKLSGYTQYRSDCAEATFLMGKTYQARGRPDKAIEQFRNVLKYYPDMKGRAAQSMSRIQELLNQGTALSPEARLQLQRSMLIYNNAIGVQSTLDVIRIAKLKINTGDKDGAKADLQSIMYNPGIWDSVDALTSLGQTQVRAGDNANAKTTLDRLLSLNTPQTVTEEHRRWRIETLYSFDEWERAIAECNESLGIHVNGDWTCEIMFYRARSYDRLGKINECLAGYDQVISSYGSTAYSTDIRTIVSLALTYSGSILMELGRNSEAIPRFQCILSEYPETKMAPQSAATNLKMLQDRGELR